MMVMEDPFYALASSKMHINQLPLNSSKIKQFKNNRLLLQSNTGI